MWQQLDNNCWRTTAIKGPNDAKTRRRERNSLGDEDERLYRHPWDYSNRKQRLSFMPAGGTVITNAVAGRSRLNGRASSIVRIRPIDRSTVGLTTAPFLRAAH